MLAFAVLFWGTVLLADAVRVPRLAMPAAVRAGRAGMTASAPSLDPAQLLRRLMSPETAKVARELVDLGVQQDPKVVVQRTIDLARALSTVGTEALSGGLSSSVDIARIAPPVVLRRMCEELGATYVKLGQFIASSPTLFPPDYVAEFQKCLDSTPPMPWRDVRPLIEAELGRPLNTVYTSVEQTPLAAASIAQVHAARLRTGEDVVIKVQRSGVQGSLRADLDLLYAVARLLQLVGLATADLTEVVGTLREAILEETDFVKEAARTTQFREFLARSPQLAGAVTAPKVYPQVLRDVLGMVWLNRARTRGGYGLGVHLPLSRVK